MIPVILSDIVRASLRIVKLSKTDEGMKRIHLEVSEIIFAGKPIKFKGNVYINPLPQLLLPHSFVLLLPMPGN